MKLEGDTVPLAFFSAVYTTTVSMIAKSAGSQGTHLLLWVVAFVHPILLLLIWNLANPQSYYKHRSWALTLATTVAPLTMVLEDRGITTTRILQFPYVYRCIWNVIMPSSYILVFRTGAFSAAIRGFMLSFCILQLWLPVQWGRFPWEPIALGSHALLGVLLPVVFAVWRDSQAELKRCNGPADLFEYPEEGLIMKEIIGSVKVDGMEPSDLGPSARVALTTSLKQKYGKLLTEGELMLTVAHGCLLLVLEGRVMPHCDLPTLEPQEVLDLMPPEVRAKVTACHARSGPAAALALANVLPPCLPAAEPSTLTLTFRDLAASELSGWEPLLVRASSGEELRPLSYQWALGPGHHEVTLTVHVPPLPHLECLRVGAKRRQRSAVKREIETTRPFVTALRPVLCAHPKLRKEVDALGPGPAAADLAELCYQLAAARTSASPLASSGPVPGIYGTAAWKLVRFLSRPALSGATRRLQRLLVLEVLPGLEAPGAWRWPVAFEREGAMNPVTLTFKDPALESRFRAEVILPAFFSALPVAYRLMAACFMFPVLRMMRQNNQLLSAWRFTADASMAVLHTYCWANRRAFRDRSFFIPLDIFTRIFSCLFNWSFFIYTSKGCHVNSPGTQCLLFPISSLLTIWIMRTTTLWSAFFCVVGFIAYESRAFEFCHTIERCFQVPGARTVLHFLSFFPVLVVMWTQERALRLKFQAKVASETVPVAGHDALGHAKEGAGGKPLPGTGKLKDL